MGGVTRLSDAGTRRASSSARFGISGLDPLAAKLAAERLAASRREALELRTRLERAERRNADLERSRGEGARRDPAGAERWLVGTTERETNGDDDDDDGDDEAGLLKNESASFAGPARDDETEAATDADRAHRARRSPARLERLELARARREIEHLREENDELRRFARSAAGADADGADDDASAASVAQPALGGGAAATAREARRLEDIIASATAGMAGVDANDDEGEEGEASSFSVSTKRRGGRRGGERGDASTEDASVRRETKTDDDDDDDDDDEALSCRLSPTPSPSGASHSSLRRELAALRAELSTQARARAILEEERDSLAARAAEREEAARASAAREAASAASLQAARRDALAAAAFGEELARSCAEKIERAEAVARAWEREARRLGRAERDDAERRVLAAAAAAEAAAIESRTLDASETASETSEETFSSPGASDGKKSRGRRPDRTPDVAFATLTPSRDSPFADSGIFADANRRGRARAPSRSPPSVSDRLVGGAVDRSVRVSVSPPPRESLSSEKENEEDAVPSTPGEALKASLRRQSETLDALRGARARRDEELRRVRDRLDRLVASPRRVAFGASSATRREGQKKASPIFAARREGRTTHAHGLEPSYDRYADPRPDPASCRAAEEEAREAYERAKRDTKRAELLSRSAEPSPREETQGGAARAVPTHPSRARPSVFSGTGSTDDADERSPARGRSNKSLFSTGGLAMPSMPSFGAATAAMNKAASTIQSAWRRKKKT